MLLGPEQLPPQRGPCPSKKPWPMATQGAWGPCKRPGGYNYKLQESQGLTPDKRRHQTVATRLTEIACRPNTKVVQQLLQHQNVSRNAASVSCTTGCSSSVCMPMFCQVQLVQQLFGPQGFDKTIVATIVWDPGFCQNNCGNNCLGPRALSKQLLRQLFGPQGVVKTIAATIVWPPGFCQQLLQQLFGPQGFAKQLSKQLSQISGCFDWISTGRSQKLF